MKREFTYSAITLLLVGLFWVVNNLLEFYFIPERNASSLLTGTISYCVFYCIISFFVKRKYVYVDKDIIIRNLIVFFVPYIVMCIALYLLAGLNTWTRIIILLSGLIIVFYVLSKSLKKKQI